MPVAISSEGWMRLKGLTVGPPISRSSPSTVSPAFERLAVGVEEAAGQVVRDAQLRGLAVEDDLGVRSQSLGPGEDLKRHVLAHNLHHLRQLAAHGGQLVVAHARGAERHGRLGDIVNLGVYLLKCSCCHGLFRFCVHIRFDLFAVILEFLGLPPE